MPAAGGDVQRARTRSKRDVRQCQRHILRIREDVRFAVVSALTLKLIPGCLLDRIESHDCSLRMISLKRKGDALRTAGQLIDLALDYY